MNTYLAAVTEWIQNIDRRAQAEQDPHRRAILENYLVHAALEYSDRWEEIFTPERTVEHPVYRVKWGTEDTVVYDGMDAVKAFYAELKDEGVLTDQDEYLSVADWGFSSFLTINLFMPGEKLLGKGVDVDDASAMYVVQQPAAMYWLYDERARLVGENVFETEVPTIKKLEPAEVVTPDDIEELIKPYLPRPVTTQAGAVST